MDYRFGLGLLFLFVLFLFFFILHIAPDHVPCFLNQVGRIFVRGAERVGCV
jgi:hypothetical protein